MATGLTDSKIHETESPSDDGSGKKKSKFKSFKKLFVKKKKKEFIVNATKTSLKQSQSTSDVTSPASCTPDLGNDQGAYKSIMGIRALSHDSIFIPDTSVQQPVKPVRVFSQESVSGPIKALQLKVQDNIKLGPPPMSIPAKKTEDTGASSEDDGLPRSPQESSPLHEILTRSYLAKYSDPYKNHSSLTLGGTGSEEEEQISPGSSSRPNSPLSAIIPTRSSSRSWSPTSPPVQISSSDSFVSPAIDFNSPPTFPICLDNSAARHKLSVKPRNQRSSSKRRRPPLRLLSEGPSEFMYNVPELMEENEQEVSNYNAENANSEISLKDRTEIPSTILTQGQSLLLTEPTIVRSSSTEVDDYSEQGMDELIHIDIATSPVVLDVSDLLKATSVPAVLSETEEDVNLMEFEIVEVAATQIPMLPGSTIALSEDPTQIDFIDPLKQEEEINLSGSEMKSTAYDTHAVSIDTSFAKETVYQPSTVIPSDMLTLDSEKPLSNAPIGTEINEVEFVQETPETSCKQIKVAATSDEPSFSEACSIRLAAKELSDHKDRSNEVPEEFSSIASTCTEVHSQPAETSQASEDLPVSETVNSGLENLEITGFKEVNVKISEDKTISQENSFKKNNQGSFKFSISSAWNRSKRDTKKWNEGELTADSDISHNKFPQKASALPGKEKKEKDVEIPLSEPSVAKIDAHKPEKTEEAQGKVDDGRGLFGVKLRSTSHSLKYKESSHSEHKETVKRHSADATLDSGGSALQPKAEKMEVKKPLEVSLGDTLKDDGKLKTKSSESLAVKPPLPKKPVLQSVSTTTTATEKPNKPVKPNQEKLKDTEKKSSVSKNSERGLLFEKHTQDNGSSIEGCSVPAWVTMARQKQKGYHVQHYSKEDKMPAQEAKAIANRKAMDKETLKSPTDLKSGHLKPLSSCKAQDCKLELKSSVAEPQQRVSPIPSPVTVNKHSLATPQNTSDKDGRDQYGKDKTSPSSSQPSWMELAKKKAKAWSDMPQIIK
ncbi:CRACD-like protein isoform X3 [Carcharodon carcharias]|nr:CRACD-like protein isoform X3 [Carcharodon carcharias]XP_041055480.1 CRACD-like protein isoform X3 [Carcharodon carcharias]XP_041055481.1 CRACD-like protein isoform X3 [Carcharodon carcharias]XP_041055482.1 CRACD-like protein isoform X3 [Carcharodon carcharias]XP_041055483.1 CRACD-like protein isoform X3 [Carcharodon carcharias]XP_041055484.1 CRACD-like protein isoform X3 [Carcharodon carcharias]